MMVVGVGEGEWEGVIGDGGGDGGGGSEGGGEGGGSSLVVVILVALIHLLIFPQFPNIT